MVFSFYDNDVDDGVDGNGLLKGIKGWRVGRLHDTHTETISSLLWTIHFVLGVSWSFGFPFFSKVWSVLACLQQEGHGSAEYGIYHERSF